MSNISNYNIGINLIPLPLRNMRAGIQDTPIRDSVYVLTSNAIRLDLTQDQRHDAIKTGMSDLMNSIAEAATALSTNIANKKIVLLDAEEAQEDIAGFPSYLRAVNEKYKLMDNDFLNDTLSKTQQILQIITDTILSPYQE